MISFRGVIELQDSGTKDETFDYIVLTCDTDKKKQIRVGIRDPESRFLSNPPPGFKPDTASIARVYRMLEDASKQGHTVRHLEAKIEAWIRFVPEQGKEDGQKPEYHVEEPRYTVYLIIQAIRDVRLLYDPGK